MQTPVAAAAAAAAEHAPAGYVVRLSGGLAAHLGRAEGAEMNEDEVLDRLREAGQISYPSPLLRPLLEQWPDVIAAEVLTRLDPMDLAMLGRVDEASRAAVVSSGMPRGGASGGVPLKLSHFCGSVERLAWARANECPWVARSCACVAEGGRLDVLRLAREHDCPWDEQTCAEGR